MSNWHRIKMSILKNSVCVRVCGASDHTVHCMNLNSSLNSHKFWTSRQTDGVKPDLVETLLVGHFWSDQIWSSIFGRAHIWSNPYLVQTHIWSGPFLVQPNLVGAIFGPTRFGRCHIWSIQIWLVYT